MAFGDGVSPKPPLRPALQDATGALEGTRTRCLAGRGMEGDLRWLVCPPALVAIPTAFFNIPVLVAFLCSRAPVDRTHALARSGEARVYSLRSYLPCVHLEVEICTTWVSLCGRRLDSLPPLQHVVMTLSPTNRGRCSRCSSVGFLGVLYISNPNIQLVFMIIPCVWGVCEWKIRDQAFTPLPRPGKSLVAQTRHENRRKAHRVDLNMW
jgi:hypothetical protein